MQPTQRTSSVKALVLAPLVLLPLVGGCNGLAESVECMWTWQRPELLYLLPTPCDRLYVEVDAVEGTEPPAESLAALQEVLRQYCDKPAGVRLARGRPIPLEQARGKPARLLALLNIDGPPPADTDDRTAYLYVLFYDSKRLGLRQIENPYVDRYYPCAIYLDMASWPQVTRHFHRQVIVHELGHVLGACKNTAHGDGLHCHNDDCVMSPLLRVPLHTLLLGLPPSADPQRTFCRECRQDLQAARAQAPDPRLSFRGPVLVRREQGYCVGFLPVCVRLWFDQEAKPEWTSLRKQILPLARKHSDGLQAETCLLYLRDDPETLQGKELAVARAARDPNPAVAGIAAGLLEQLPQHARHQSGDAAGIRARAGQDWMAARLQPFPPQRAGDDSARHVDHVPAQRRLRPALGVRLGHGFGRVRVHVRPGPNDVRIAKETSGGTACLQAVFPDQVPCRYTGCKQPVPPFLLFLWQGKVQ